MRVLIVHRSARDALDAARPILATGAEVVVTTSATQARAQAGQFDRGRFSHDLEEWIAWHNRIHHGHTNEADVDPDAYPTLKEHRKSRAVRVAPDFAAPGRERYAGVL
jgi:hypothetical protein